MYSAGSLERKVRSMLMKPRKAPVGSPFEVRKSGIA